MPWPVLGLGLLLLLWVAPLLHAGAPTCDALAMVGDHVGAESCYAAAAAAQPGDADVAFNWGVTVKNIALDTGGGAEAAALLRRALALYEQAVAFGGQQQPFLYALADAHCRLNQLDSAVAIYTAIDNWRRGVPYNASGHTATAISHAERTVRDNRAITTGDKLAKLRLLWEHRFSDDFGIVAGRICEPDEVAHLHAVFGHTAPLDEPMIRWFYHTVGA